MRVAIIGVGGTGSAAARHMAQRGHSVVGYERFQIGHVRGSSHGESRIIRYTYPDLLYTQMMGDAYPLWAKLEEEAGETLFVRCGGLYFGDLEDANLHATEKALQDTGLPYDRLSAKQTEARFPAFRLSAKEGALFQPESGFLKATRCVLANVRLAQQAGAEIREETPVRDILERKGERIVQTEDGDTQAFDRVIVTAGAWMGGLFSRLRLPLTVTRQQVTYLEIGSNADYFAQGAFPVWIDTTCNYYGFPQDGALPGAKIASHHFGEETDPNAPPREVDESYVASVCDYAATRFPDLSPKTSFRQTCLYTVAPNEDFILDSVPGSPHVWLVSGCSGHGFKFTVLLGEIAARKALGEDYPRDISRFSLSRFVS